MVFSSMIFLWIFLPAVFLLSRCVREYRLQNLLLLAASLVFYAWGEPVYILLLLFSVAMNYVFGILLDGETGSRRLWLALAVIGNLSLLGFFKYCNFFLHTLDRLLPWIRLPRVDISLPIGISFFTFQAMSYVIDLYRGEYRAQKNILYLALYISFFPQLIAGPIVKYREIETQLVRRSAPAEKVAEGFRRFIYGLGKKVIISNLLAISADRIFSAPKDRVGFALSWCGALFYTLQIYYDFSGYSDMAIGLGRMMGFSFPVNFDHPYTASSVAEFWSRWHITLSRFFRDYVYIPLGGSRCKKTRAIFNMFIVFS